MVAQRAKSGWEKWTMQRGCLVVKSRSDWSVERVVIVGEVLTTVPTIV